MSEQNPTQPPPPEASPNPEPEPAYTPTELEKQAHQAYLDAILPAVGRRIDVLITTTVQQSGHGDYAIWLPLYAMDLALRGLTYSHDAKGYPLSKRIVIENHAKLNILAAIALERFAKALRDVVAIDVERINAGAVSDEPLPNMTWTGRDQNLCYDDALEQLDEMILKEGDGQQ